VRTFSLLFVTAWNSLAIAILQKQEAEWRKIDDDGAPRLVDGVEQSEDTVTLVGRAFPGVECHGLDATP
jgi:hypothetical protein